MNFNNTHKQQLEARLSAVKSRLDNTVNCLIDGAITKDIYDTKTSQFKQEIAEIEHELSQCVDNYDEIGDIIENMVEICGNVKNLLKSSSNEEKRAILKLISSNSTIEGRNAWFSLKKPFDLLQKSDGRTLWSGRKDSNLRHLAPKASTLPD